MPRNARSSPGLESRPEPPGPPADRGASGRPSTQLERVTVNLTARASRALEHTVTLTGDSKTDVINRALQVYAHLEQIIHSGGGVYTKEAQSKELEKLMFF